MESQIAIIKSTVFLRRVVERTNLVSDPEFGSHSPKIATPQTDDRTPMLPPLQPRPNHLRLTTANIPSDVMASIQRLRGAIAVGRAGQGYILSISATSVDPERAARIANAVADAYVVEKLDARFEAAKRGSAWLSDRLVDLRKQLHDSEEAVADFRKEHGFLQSNTNVTLNQQQLSELNAKLLAARAETADKKARVDLLNSIEEKGGNIQSLPDLASSPIARRASPARGRNFAEGSRSCRALQRSPSTRRQRPRGTQRYQTRHRRRGAAIGRQC